MTSLPHGLFKKMGLVGANCNIWNGWTMGSYCTAQGTVRLGHFAVQQIEETLQINYSLIKKGNVI